MSPLGSWHSKGQAGQPSKRSGPSQCNQCLEVSENIPELTHTYTEPHLQTLHLLLLVSALEDHKEKPPLPGNSCLKGTPGYLMGTSCSSAGHFENQRAGHVVETDMGHVSWNFL